MFMALIESGIRLPKKQRLPGWGDAKAQHLLPSLSPGSAFSLPGQGAWARLSEPGLLLFLFSLALFFSGVLGTFLRVLPRD